MATASESDPAPGVDDAGTAAAPRLPFARLFVRFLKFGFLAWGGPMAQIDMLRHELVEQERWISPAHFRRLLAIYQVLPGPEATELCVHLGVLSRGRWGGVVSGLGFVLPGFSLMFALSWLYLHAALGSPVFVAAFLGVQPAVIALIVRAVQRIGQHCLLDTWLVGIAAAAAVAEALGVTFWLTLAMAGLAYVLAVLKRRSLLAVLAIAFAGALALLSPVLAGRAPLLPAPEPRVALHAGAPTQANASVPAVFAAGLRAGLLTFGGAYTVIPFLERDAVQEGRWLTRGEFLDGLALSGMLPAPLIIFSTFVGFFAAGALGALAMTVAIFLPAFGFSIVLHRHLEAVVRIALVRHFLEGVTAGVVGLIGIAAVRLAVAALTSVPAAVIAIVAFALLTLWRAKAAVPIVIGGAALVGILWFRQQVAGS